MKNKENIKNVNTKKDVKKNMGNEKGIKNTKQKSIKNIVAKTKKM